MNTANLRVEVAQGQDEDIISFAGHWTVRDWHQRLRHVRSLPKLGARVVLDLRGVTRLDVFGAALVLRLQQDLVNQGIGCRLLTAKSPSDRILSRLAHTYEAYSAARTVQVPGARSYVNRLYLMSRRFGARQHAFVGFLGLVCERASRYLRQPRAFRTKSFLDYIDRVGVRALLIIGLIAFLIGVVLTYQGVSQLRQFGAEALTVNLLVVAVLRELGILLTAIVVAGRTGSAFTAQIGFMKLNQELDALKVMGVSTLDLVVMPRIMALILCLPLLAVYCDLVALSGGAVMAKLLIDMSFGSYLEQVRAALTPWTFWTGLIKAPVFAFIIGLVACHQGLRVTGGSEQVGRRTTRSVVQSIFTIIVFDALFSILYAELGI